MARIGFSVDEIIAEMEKDKKKDRKDSKKLVPKIQRLGPSYIEFYLQDPLH
jgi:hypothetical protein